MGMNMELRYWFTNIIRVTIAKNDTVALFKVFDFNDWSNHAPIVFFLQCLKYNVTHSTDFHTTNTTRFTVYW
jgi:hypothetical protein